MLNAVRVKRLVKIGLSAQGKERVQWWVKAFTCEKLSETLDDEAISEQFKVSDDTIRNARRAYGLYSELRAIPEVRIIIREIRREMDKTNWEIIARFYANHKSLGDALNDVRDARELTSRELEAVLDLKYNKDPLPRTIAAQKKTAAHIIADIWGKVDKIEQGERREVAARLAARAQRAKEFWIGSLESVMVYLQKEG